MGEWQSRVESKIDKMSDRQNDQAVTLERLTVSVEDHVKRTNLLEADIKPIKRHVAMVEGALKLLGILGVLAAILETVHTFFR